MDNPTTTTTDDAELAKVLESMNENTAPAAPATDSTAPATDQPATASTPAEPQFEVPPLPPVEDSEPVVAAAAAAAVAQPAQAAPALSPELESIKKDAVEELRPLVDKLDLPADEKFDTLLLIIRSTDDHALIAPAHEAAKAITDEAKRAQALLDVIKEIDYFSNPNSTQ